MYYDYCNFWHKLESLKDNVFVSTETVTSLQKSFSDGYGVIGGVDSPLFCVVRCRYTINSMLNILEYERKSPLEKLKSLIYRRTSFDWLNHEILS